MRATIGVLVTSAATLLGSVAVMGEESCVLLTPEHQSLDFKFAQLERAPFEVDACKVDALPLSETFAPYLKTTSAAVPVKSSAPIAEVDLSVQSLGRAANSAGTKLSALTDGQAELAAAKAQLQAIAEQNPEAPAGKAAKKMLELIPVELSGDESNIPPPVHDHDEKQFFYFGIALLR